MPEWWTPIPLRNASVAHLGTDVHRCNAEISSSRSALEYTDDISRKENWGRGSLGSKELSQLVPVDCMASLSVLSGFLRRANLSACCSRSAAWLLQSSHREILRRHSGLVSFHRASAVVKSKSNLLHIFSHALRSKLNKIAGCQEIER